MRIKINNLISGLLFVVFTLFVFTGMDIPKSTKKVYCTELNGDGCVCHTVIRSPWVSVWVKGPDTVRAGQSAVYAMYLANGPAKAGGYNVATRFGTLAILDTISVLLDNEITQRIPLVFPTIHDTIHWYFKYTAPMNKTEDTIYSCGISVNYDGEPSELDEWNYGAKFKVNIIQGALAVELSDFSGKDMNEQNVLCWTVKSESENKGFYIERSVDAAYWESHQFIPSKGNNAAGNNYIFTEKGNPTTKQTFYRLSSVSVHGDVKILGQITIDNDGDYARSFSSIECFPNPFNPGTQVKAVLPNSSNVQLQVYSIQGALLFTKIFGSVEAGEYTLPFDASGLASGVYLGVLSGVHDGQKFSRSVKMVYLR